MSVSGVAVIAAIALSCRRPMLVIFALIQLDANYQIISASCVEENSMICIRPDRAEFRSSHNIEEKVSNWVVYSLTHIPRSEEWVRLDAKYETNSKQLFRREFHDLRQAGASFPENICEVGVLEDINSKIHSPHM